MHYPADPQQPGPIFFKTLRKCALFKVCCDAYHGSDKWCERPRPWLPCRHALDVSPLDEASPPLRGQLLHVRPLGRRPAASQHISLWDDTCDSPGISQLTGWRPAAAEWVGQVAEWRGGDARQVARQTQRVPHRNQQRWRRLRPADAP